MTFTDMLINQHVNADILTAPRAVVTSIPLCDIDSNVSMSPLLAASSISVFSSYSNNTMVQLSFKPTILYCTDTMVTNKHVH